MYGYNLKLKTTTFGGEVNILDSQDVRFIRGGITIDATTVTDTFTDESGLTRKVLKAGSPVGKITATGKYGPYDKDATDGRQTAKYIIPGDVEVTNGDAVTTAYDRARLIEARLPVTFTADMKSQLKNFDFV